jgi:3-methylcrotonyl-CoA carboxylase alpha subunit
MITGEDLVAWQLRIAAGERLPARELAISGHAIEVRLYAEDPAKNFFPAPGTLHRLRLPESEHDLIVDAGVAEGGEVTLHYDPMIAKLVAHGPSRATAIDRLRAALRSIEVAGVRTNAAFLSAALAHPEFRGGAIDTGFIERNLGALVAGVAPGEETLVAAALHLALAAAPQNGPWSQADGWRVSGAKARPGAPFRFKSPGAAETSKVLLAFRAGEIEADIDGAKLSLTTAARADGAHEFSFRSADGVWRNRRMSFARAGTRLFVMCEGATHELLIAAPFEPEEADAGPQRAIAAPLAGRIVSVQAQAGQKVRRGQALVVLEAMKMEHTLVAESEGVIERVACSAGDQVKEGQVIVAFAAAAI